MILTNLYTLKQRNEYKAKLSELKEDKKLLDDLLIETAQSRLRYFKISLELNNICNKYQSSRNEKNKNKDLLKLMEE